MDKFKSLVSVKTNDEVEIEISPNYDIIDNNEYDKNLILINQRIQDVRVSISETDKLINKLENQADCIDIAVSAGCGVLTGILDIFFCGDMAFDKAHNLGTKQIDTITMLTAKLSGYKGSDNSGAISFLRKSTPVSKSLFKKNSFHSLSNHPSVGGLVFSILANISGKSFGFNNSGELISKSVNISDNIGHGVLNGVVNWSSNVCNKEVKGVPGAINSVLNEMSSLDTFKNMDLKKSEELTNIINEGINTVAGGDTPLDFKTELGLLTRQTTLVILNEVIVRAFYFIRRLCKEIKENNIKSIKDLKYINWKNTLPFKNRTITRMLSVSMATMSAVDIIDAAVESLVKSKGNQASFITGFLFRVNYVGLARMTFQCSSDVIMGIKLHNRRKERIELVKEYIELNNSKICYKQADMWQTAMNTEVAIKEAAETLEKAFDEENKKINEIKDDMKKISESLESVDSKNPGLKDDIKNIIS